MSDQGSRDTDAASGEIVAEIRACRRLLEALVSISEKLLQETV